MSGIQNKNRRGVAAAGFVPDRGVSWLDPVPVKLSPQEHLQRWFQVAIAIAGACSVVATQALMAFPGWSRLGISSVVVLLGVLTVGWILGAVRFSPGKWMIFPILFCGYSLCRGIPGEGEEWALDPILQAISACLLGFGVAFALDAGMPFKSLAYAQLLSSYVSILGGFFSDTSVSENDLRYSGLVGNANEFSLQLSLGTCLVWLFPKKSGWIAAGLAIVAAIYGVATSGSRSALTLLPMLLMVCGFQALAEVKKHRAFIVFVVASVGFAVCLVGLAFAPKILEEASQITAVKRLVDYKDSSFDKRSAMIRTGIQLWKKSPVFGNGPVAFVNTSGFEVYSHNNYVELLCNMGVVGLVLFYATHVFILWQSLWFPFSLKLATWGAILINLVADTGIVSYDRKQTVLVLIVLASLTARYGRPAAVAVPVSVSGRPGQRKLATSGPEV